MTAHPPTVAVVIALQPLRRAGARDEEPDAGACRPARTTAPRHAIDVACIAVPTALPAFRAWRIGPTRGSESAPCTAMHGNGNAECNNLKSMAGHEHANRRGPEPKQTGRRLTEACPQGPTRKRSSSSCPHPSMSRAGPRRYGNQSSPFSSAHRMKAPGSKGTRYSLRTRSSATAEIVSPVSRP